MAISLSAETERLIVERLQQGGYATADDVVQAALFALSLNGPGDFAPGELDQLIAEGETGEPLDGEKVMAELRKLWRIT